MSRTPLFPSSIWPSSSTPSPRLWSERSRTSSPRSRSTKRIAAISWFTPSVTSPATGSVMSASASRARPLGPRPVPSWRDAGDAHRGDSRRPSRPGNPVICLRFQQVSGSCLRRPAYGETALAAGRGEAAIWSPLPPGRWCGIIPIFRVNGSVRRGSAMTIGKHGPDLESLQQLVDSLPALIHTGRPDGYLDFFNRRWLDFVGLRLEDLEGWKWTAAIHPDDVTALVTNWRACLESGRPLEIETRVRRADGVYRWMLHQKQPLRNAEGQIVRWYGSSVDIDDRKPAEFKIDEQPT